MTQQSFPYTEALQFGWQKTKSNLATLVGSVVLVYIVSGFVGWIGGVLGMRSNSSFLVFVFQILSIIVQIFMTIGLIKTLLNVYNNKPTSINEFVSHSELLPNVFLSSIVYVLIVFAGVLLFIIPGIIWAIKYQFMTYLVIDKGMGVMDAMRKSGEMTKGYTGALFLFGILIVLVNLAGAAALFIGLLITIPVTLMAYVYVYRMLLGNMSAQPQGTTAQTTAQQPQSPAQDSPIQHT